MAWISVHEQCIIYFLSRIFSSSLHDRYKKMMYWHLYCWIRDTLKKELQHHTMVASPSSATPSSLPQPKSCTSVKLPPGTVFEMQHKYKADRDIGYIFLAVPLRFQIYLEPILDWASSQVQASSPLMSPTYFKAPFPRAILRGGISNGIIMCFGIRVASEYVQYIDCNTSVSN